MLPRVSGCLVAGWCLMVAGAVPAPAQVDVLALRKAAEPSVCQVVVEGPLGLPIAFASGFVMGKGGFVVTDLATVSQPGAAKVTVRFSDGTTAEATQFGMADAATSLVALRLEGEAGQREGLAIRPEAVGEDGTAVLALGWQWGESLAVTRGRLVPGPAPAALAEQTACQAPSGPADFYTFLCPRCDLATGAPLLAEDGTAVAVLLQMIGTEKPMAVSAASVRKALLEAGTDLKPLAALPVAVWPTDLVLYTGQPPTPATFAAAVRLVKRRSVCSRCKGTGKIWIRKFVGTRRVMNRIQRIYRREQKPCPNCDAEGIVFPSGLYAQFAQMAEGAATILSAPGTPQNVREAALENSMGLLDALGQVSATYRKALFQHAADDLGRGAGEWPRGFVTYARVAETVNLRGDAFTVLQPSGASTPLIVQADMLSAYYGPQGGAGKARARAGTWVVTGGTLVGRVKIQGQRLVFARLFGWAPGPSFAPPSRRAALVDEKPPPTVVAAAEPEPLPQPEPQTQPEPEPTTTEPEPTATEPEPAPAAAPPPAPRRRPRPPRPVRREKKPGEPNFFGL